MNRDVERILISRQQIDQRLGELATQIAADHQNVRADGTEAGEFDNELTIVPILTGAMIFCCDLIRQIPIAMRIGLMTVSSYPGSSISTQGSKVLSQQFGNLKGRHVVLLDDILDSGGTIRAVRPILEDSGAASVKVCVLLRKDRPEAMATPVEYVGFEIPDEFVVGYGLDYNDYYRNVPDIVTLTAEAIERQRK